MKNSRRGFLISTLGVASSLALSGKAFAADAPKLSESDPSASALGYKTDASKVDKAKFPKYAAGQKCGSCQFYQGSSAASGPCSVFAGKQVEAAGWCNAYSKKA